MSHKEQLEFCDRVKSTFPDYFNKSRVLEIGSRNLNGSIRGLFTECDYVGIDCMKGKDVDVVCLAHKYEDDQESFDVVCCAESLEHDPYAPQTILSMLSFLKSGGLFFCTCASTGRKEHGTVRQKKSWKLCGPDHKYYKNVKLSTLVQWMLYCGFDFDSLHYEYNESSSDLYCYAIKAISPHSF